MPTLTSEAEDPVTEGVTRLRAAIYLRISQDPNEDGLAVARQRGDCERIVRERGWTLTEIYSDTLSASKRNVKRLDYERMVRDFTADQFDALVCWDLDRLTRQPRQLEDWIDLAEQRGLSLVTASGEADLTTDNGRMFARIKATVARAEVERKAARQKAKNLQLIEEGKPVPGRRRFGYESNNMLLRPAEATWVAYAFKSVIEGKSLLALAKEFTAEGVPLNSKAPRWTPRRMRDMLTNESYGGMVRHTVAGVTTVKPSPHVTPLVPADVAERVRTILADPSRRTTPGAEVKHLLSGMAVCGVCGARMKFMRSYRCRDDASHPSIKKETLEGIVLREVTGALLLGPTAILPTSTDESGTLRDLDAALTAVQHERKAVEGLLRDRLMDAATVRPILAKLKAEDERLAARRSHLMQTSVAVEVLAGLKADIFDGHTADLSKAAEAKRAIEERVQALSLHRHRELLQMLLTVEVHPGRSTDRVHISHKVVTTLNNEAHL